MEHLYSKFRLLKQAIDTRHTPNEISGLCRSIKGSALRVLGERKHKYRTKKLFEKIIRAADEIKSRSYDVYYGSAFKSDKEYKILNRMERNIQNIIKILKIKYEEVKTEYEEVKIGPLISKFRLLVLAVQSRHSTDEIAGLCESLRGSTIRILDEHDYRGKLKRSFTDIMKKSGLIEDYSYYIYSPQKEPKVRKFYQVRLNEALLNIQRDILAIAKNLKIEYEDVKIEFEEVST